jgi:ubiquinone/menaquinone biosynthesis C-methylase UbiE
MIVQVACNTLNLSKNDKLLDLCCGNGALTTYFFEACSGGLGVDFSEYLIGVARKHFIKSSYEAYLLEDILKFAREYSHPDQFTKAICYGSIQYLPRQSVTQLLGELRNRFIKLQSLFIGNVPDKKYVMDFFKDEYEQGIENSPQSPIGRWWSKEEFIKLAKSTGWIPKFSKMSKNFYCSHYRFDVILTPDMEH